MLSFILGEQRYCSIEAVSIENKKKYQQRGFIINKAPLRSVGARISMGQSYFFIQLSSRTVRLNFAILAQYRFHDRGFSHLVGGMAKYRCCDSLAKCDD